MSNLKAFVKEIEVLNPAHTVDQKIFQKFIKIMTPSDSKHPVLTVRNIRVLFYGIFNMFEEWMNQQDPFEFDSLKESIYQRKIWKYKMMMSKLNSDSSEALFHSSKSQFELLENVPKDLLSNLTEAEKE